MRKLIDSIAGRKLLQPMFEWFYTAGVYGMNYGNNGFFNISGELYAAKMIRKALEQQYKSFQLFDVGGNSGKYALALGKVFEGTSFQMYSFEPSQIIFDTMAAAVAINPKIQPVHFGLGASDAEMTLYKRSQFSGLSSVYNRRLEHFKMDMPIREQVQIIRLDDFCANNQIDRIHFLKMDIEGHELSCLQGAGKLLTEKKIDFIQFEFGGCNIDSRTYFQDFWYLLKDDYTFYRIVKNGFVAIKNYNERLEIFKNINFLAVLKINNYEF